jgi:tetratricopeptide (TPR) repeat protein
MLTLAAVLLVAQAVAVPPPAPRPGPEASRAEAYYHFSLGLQARFTGDGAAALEEYRRAQKLDPGSADIRVETARLLRDMGRIDEALVEAQEAVRLDPKEASGFLTLGQLRQLKAEGAEAEKEIKAAAAAYEEAVRLEPTDGSSLLALAGIYGQLLQHKDAIRIWRLYLSLDPGSFDAHVRLGSHLLAVGETDQAAAALKGALELQPDSARTYKALGDIYAKATQSDQAVLHYRKALELDPGNLPVRLALGEVLSRARRPKEALAEADAVLKADSKNRFALDLRGRALRDLRDFEGAAKAVDQLLGEDATDLKAAYLKVTIAEAKRDYAAAAVLLEEILARKRTGEDPEEGASNDRVFLIHLGFAYQAQSRFAEAAQAFARAAETGGEPDAALLGYRVEALFLAKELDTALTAVRAARARFPDEPDLASLEATVLRARGDQTAAFQIIEELSRKSEGNVKVLGEVADFYRRAQRYPDAEAALRRALEADPKNLGVLFQLGAVIERQKRLDDADAVFREALRIEPDSAPILNYLGYMNADRNVKVEEALRFIEKAVTLDPENNAYLDSLGWAQYKLGRVEEAERNVRKSLLKQANNAVVLDHLGDILKAQGRLAEALEFWQKALRGEDEEGELDRVRVQRKVTDAQVALQTNPARP